MKSSEATDPGDLPKLVGRYEVVRRLGEGAMGRVLLAHDPVLDRDVAIKHLRSDLTLPRDARAALVRRMEHEAKAAARVAHPNLVVLHDMGEDAAVGLFLVFEFIDGPTLKERLLEGALSPAESAKLARELGGALTCAHRAGVLHRDVKPENVMLASTGAKIADFGIARVPDSTLTHQGGLLGTPAYSAPETFGDGEFSPASDQFSLAATVYEAASGLRAFPGDDALSVAAMIRDSSAARVATAAGLPREVDGVLLRALEREPAARYASCEAFGEAFARAAVAPSEAELDDLGSRGGAEFTRNELPPERKLPQVLIGGAVVVVTAALLVHAGLRSLEGASAEPAPTSASPAASVAPPSSTATAPQATPRARRHAPATSSAVAAPSASAAVAPVAAASATASAAEPAGPGARETERPGPTASVAPAGTVTGSATASASGPRAAPTPAAAARPGNSSGVIAAPPTSAPRR